MEGRRESTDLFRLTVSKSEQQDITDLIELPRKFHYPNSMAVCQDSGKFLNIFIMNNLVEQVTLC